MKGVNETTSIELKTYIDNSRFGESYIRDIYKYLYLDSPTFQNILTSMLMYSRKEIVWSYTVIVHRMMKDVVDHYDLHILNDPYSVTRLMIVCLLIATKFVEDCHVSLKVFARVSNTPLKWLIDTEYLIYTKYLNKNISEYIYG